MYNVQAISLSSAIANAPRVGLETPVSSLQPEFEQWLKASSLDQPVHTLVKHLQGASQAYDSQLSALNHLDEVTLDAAEALKLQVAMASAAMTVDLSAKLTSSCTQAINRLVSIQ